MIPAYKVTLFTSLGASLYMMGRLVLVSELPPTLDFGLLTLDRGTRPGGARTKLSGQGGRYPCDAEGRPSGNRTVQRITELHPRTFSMSRSNRMQSAIDMMAAMLFGNFVHPFLRLSHPEA